MTIDRIILGFSRIFLPLFRKEAVQVFSHPDPERNEAILDALDEQAMFEDIEDVLQDEPIN